MSEFYSGVIWGVICGVVGLIIGLLFYGFVREILRLRSLKKRNESDIPGVAPLCLLRAGFLESRCLLRSKMSEMVRVHISRFHPSLKPGNGESIDWKTGETVEIISGQDKGRKFIITSESMRHASAPGKYVREGYFKDDPAKTTWCKLEEAMWML